MKNKILIILLLCFISCKMDNHKPAEVRKIKKSTDTIFLNEQGDTIKTQTAYLKNNYKLIIFPAIDKNEEVINFRLINGKKDNTYLLVDTFIENYRPYYEGVDFKNYFALHSNGGGTSNFYFWLYDKETGNEVLNGITGDFDLKNELILYTDEDDEYNLFIYDVNTKIKTLINLPYELMDKQKCTKYNNSPKTLYIRRVTNEYYYLAFEICKPLLVEFKVKKSK
ncbi:hypothetical protein ACFQFA_16810 [Flavobacterium panici]|uniref:hypothetical protein n=1 Tax=Flavobacterium panici TaxID=2654843 RepID=UPI0036084917